MKLYEHQRSRSFIDLGPRLLRFNIFKFVFLKIVAKFHIEPPWDIGMKIDWSKISYEVSMGDMVPYAFVWEQG